jgi:hypothetical protein
LQRWIRGNSSWDFKSIYFVYLLGKQLGLEMKPELKQQLDRAMAVTIRTSSFDQFETNYLVFLLKYYPEHVEALNILQFTPKAYLGYLSFYKERPDIPLKVHKIPPNVLQLSTSDNFIKIQELRF